MLTDNQYLKTPFSLSEFPHHYGKNVHLLADPFLLATLEQLASPECHQPRVNALLTHIYRDLIKQVVNAEFPQHETEIETRMAKMHPEGRYRCRTIDRNTKAVCVNLARAGTVPSQICYDFLNYLLEPHGVRQDHISINRKTDASERVVGTQLGGLKIGGGIDNSVVIIPDPMGATGSTIESALDIYSQQGKPLKFLALHLIVTPEYLKKMQKYSAILNIYAVRLDRGLTPANLLQTTPGQHWAQEKGLNEKQYIVPGAGGLGEVINNAYV